MDIYEDQIIVPDVLLEPIILVSLKSLTLYSVEFESTETTLVLINEYF